MRAPVKPEKDGVLLTFLYRCKAGRMVLKWFCSRAFSSAAGSFLDSSFSRALIRPFIRIHRISMKDCVKTEFKSFNDFFCRRLRKESRPVDLRPNALIAPCDGLLSAYRIDGDTVIPVKQSRYTLSSLFDGDEIGRQFEGGICLVYRLTVGDYHRYCYVDNGVKGDNYFIPGKLHTVRPIALREFPVFTENCREYTRIRTENFGTLVQMEVGAMLVGKIHNHHGGGTVRRGQEKGMFLYGGSTVLVLLQKGRAVLPERLFQASAQGWEVPVRQGERVGTAVC